MKKITKLVSQTEFFNLIHIHLQYFKIKQPLTINKYKKKKFNFSTENLEKISFFISLLSSIKEHVREESSFLAKAIHFNRLETNCSQELKNNPLNENTNKASASAEFSKIYCYREQMPECRYLQLQNEDNNPLRHSISSVQLF